MFKHHSPSKHTNSRFTSLESNSIWWNRLDLCARLLLCRLLKGIQLAMPRVGCSGCTVSRLVQKSSARWHGRWRLDTQTFGFPWFFCQSWHPPPDTLPIFAEMLDFYPEKQLMCLAQAFQVSVSSPPFSPHQMRQGEIQPRSNNPPGF